MGILLMKMFVLFMFLFLLSMLWLYWKKSKGFFQNREKLTPFECGFDPNKISRLPFSLRFFLLLIFFLMFDLEIILLLELPLLYYSHWLKIWYYIFIFMLILFLGFLEEWRRGALNWKM